MATSKPKKTVKKSSTKPKATVKSAKAEKVKKPEKVEAKKVEKVEKVESKACDWKFFGRKYSADESILTIFKNKKIWGALIGELLGTMFISIVLLTFGANYILYIMLAIVAIIMTVYTLSGAHLNPIVTVGMMVTRRVSVIRGVLYIIAQVLGAWLALLLITAFRAMGGEMVELPAMAAVSTENFGFVVAIEILGALIIGFFFARAQQYKRSALTFAFLVMGGLVLALITGLWFSGNYLGLTNNYIMNPAIALMMQIFPSAGENVGEVLGGIGLALAAYAVLPAVAGTIGFFISDLTSKLGGEKVCEQ